MRHFLALALLATLAACGGFQNADSRLDRASMAVDTGLDRFAATTVRPGGAQVSDRPFVAAQRERDSAAARLPARVQGANAVILQSRDQMGLPEIATRLTEATGIQHVLALGPSGQRVQTPALPGAGAAATAPSSGIRIRPNLRGPLSNVLDEIARAFDVDWTYENNRIVIRDFVTRDYAISALPLTSSVSTAISANSISAGTQAQLDVWAEVRESLQAIAGSEAVLSFAPSSGTVSVTARISDHARIANHVRSINQRVGQQVAFDVNVITVTLNEGEAFGVDLNAALSRSGISVTAIGSPQVTESAGNINIGIIRNGVDVQAVARSLSRFGRVSVETRAGTTTANNRPAPIEVIDRIAYLAEVSIDENTTTGRERINRRADTVDIGFQMQLLPRILNTRDIMVQYIVRISELNNLRTFGDGNEAIQLPEISTTSFEQQAVLENGQTLIMAGFERRRVERENRGGFGVLSISRGQQFSTQRVATVVMITPTIVRR